jgi:hypothetical protein
MGQQDALNTDLSAFAQEGVPVSTLWMLSSSNAGQAAQPFLQGIAQQTGGSFVRVGNAADMAQAVRTFCQMNCGLKFEPLEYNPVGHDYITTLDDTARYFALLTFYETGTTGNVLGIAGREIPPQAVITSLDNKHYELDTLHLLHQACPCKITVDTGGDERPQIYALTQSLPQKVPPGPVPCVGVWQCLVPPHLWLLAAGILVFLVILALLWAWRNSPEPFGYLVDARNERKAIKLGEGQWWTPYRRRSVIEVSDRTIREKFPLLADVPIQFVYHPDQKGREQAYARLKKHGAQTSVCIKNSSHAVSLSREKSEAVLEHGSEIQVNGRPIVIFQTREPAVLHRHRIR